MQLSTPFTSCSNFFLSYFLYFLASSGWDIDPVTGVEYQRNVQAALTWHQARKSCQQQGADLLSIVELHEQSYITGTEVSLLSVIRTT